MIPNGTPLDSATAKRIAQKQQAYKLAKQWSDAMSANDLSAIVVGFTSPLDDAMAMLLGRIDEEVRALGLAIVSHSHFIVGQVSTGSSEKPVEVPVANLSFLIRTQDGAARKIIA